MQKLIGIASALIALTLLAGTVLATSSIATPIQNPPASATGSPILQISYQVNNDEDSGIVGYWGLDSFTKTVTVWNTAVSGTDVVYVGYSGTFCTYAGALSPSAGITEPSDGCGTMTGAYNGTLITSSGPTSTSSPSTVDAGGSKADILKGTYAKQTGNAPNQLDWVSTYFPGATFNQLDWSWTYSLPNGANGGTQWINQATDLGGNSGDIVTGQNSVVASTSVPQATCGIAVSGSLAFGNVPQGTTSSQKSVTITNGGTVATTSLTVYGTQWTGINGNTMPVGQTQVYDGTWYPLPSTPGTIFGGVVPANSGTVSPIFTVTIPATQPGDTYSQVITFNAGC